MKISSIKDRYESKISSLYGQSNVRDSLALAYHEHSKYTEYGMRMVSERILGFSNKYIVERSSQPFKIYPIAFSYDLSVYVKTILSKTLQDCLYNRRSVRKYDQSYKISLNELANILYGSYGITGKTPISGSEGHMFLRAAPSGGALYPLELYVVILNSHIPNGLYHYRVDNNSLELLKEGDFLETLLKVVQAQPYVDLASASAVVITTGVIERHLIKYGERGYRFMIMESGIVAQSMTLIAESLDLCSCMLGGYNDDKINEFIDIDGVFESVNNVLALGKQIK